MLQFSEETREQIIEELENDFMTELKKIDFSDYSPRSEVFMYPVTIGMLHFLLTRDTKEESDIQEEIDGARKYMELHEQTSDAAYKTLASDELKHARMLIGMSKVRNPMKDVSKYEKEINALQSKMSM